MANNILYIGKFFPRNMLKTITTDSKGKVGMSNHNFEMSIINGLCQVVDIDLHCVSIPGVFSFPYNNKKLYTNPESYPYKRAHVHSVGFCNLPIIKEVWSTIALILLLVKIFHLYKGDRVDIIVNTPYNGLLTAVRYAKIFTAKKITQTVIIPDIPSMMTAMDKQGKFKGAVLKHRDNRSMKMTSSSDGLVLLTESMMDFIDHPIPYIVMEGIIDIEGANMKSITPHKDIILYTGSLRKIFGVMNLVKAFQMLPNDDIELWICGSGDAAEDIKTVAFHDNRIKFYGLVSSENARDMQRKATILVNPRTCDGEYTKYSFPSKTMEYLLSGKSVIINRLPGIPEEYYNFVYTPNGETVEALAECIANVLTMDLDARNSRSQRGRDFIINFKNSKIQTERILDMISKY